MVMVILYCCRKKLILNISGTGKWPGIGAIHNHFFMKNPDFYVHVHGMGTIAELAKRYADTIRDSKVFPANQPTPVRPQQLRVKKIFDIPAL